MDTSAHFGMNVLLRFCVLCKPFPEFLDGEDYTKRPVFVPPVPIIATTPTLSRILIGMPYSRCLASIAKRCLISSVSNSNKSLLMLV
jgi:hypothetical protein